MPMSPIRDDISSIPVGNSAGLSSVIYPRISHTPNGAAVATGFSETRIWDAIRKNELTAIKHGKATVIADAELRRWLASLPTRGRSPEKATA
jgi:hypothetical protein